MKRAELIYLAYLAFLLIFCASLFIPPLLSFSDEENGRKAYALFSPLCHQKLSRSICIFHDQLGYYIDDCTPQNGSFVPNDQRLISSERNGSIGYKFPVCSRDVGIYFAMLLGAAAYPLIRRIEDEKIPPPIYLIIALIPIALDGGIQFLSDLGILPFVYESTNIVRLITGGISGFVASIYVIPILVNLFSEYRR